MIMLATTRRLADRLGSTWHVSPLMMKIRRLTNDYPTQAERWEDWLIDVANQRGANVVSRPGSEPHTFVGPSEGIFPCEELVVGLCLLGGEDRLQSLRLAAQLISRQDVRVENLVRLARMERIESILGAMAKSALCVDPHHDTWKSLFTAFGARATPRPLLHWTRLAEPIPDERHVASGRWRLVA